MTTACLTAGTLMRRLQQLSTLKPGTRFTLTGPHYVDGITVTAGTLMHVNYCRAYVVWEERTIQADVERIVRSSDGSKAPTRVAVSFNRKVKDSIAPTCEVYVETPARDAEEILGALWLIGDALATLERETAP